jgi:hypothetical protein
VSAGLPLSQLESERKNVEVVDQSCNLVTYNDEHRSAILHTELGDLLITSNRDQYSVLHGGDSWLVTVLMTDSRQLRLEAVRLISHCLLLCGATNVAGFTPPFWAGYYSGTSFRQLARDFKLDVALRSPTRSARNAADDVNHSSAAVAVTESFLLFDCGAMCRCGVVIDRITPHASRAETAAIHRTTQAFVDRHLLEPAPFYRRQGVT